MLTSVEAQPDSSLDRVAGQWTISDAIREVVGHSAITVQTPNALIFEERNIEGSVPQELWLERLERAQGWMKLFLGPNGIREVLPQSHLGQWPWCSAHMCASRALRLSISA